MSEVAREIVGGIGASMRDQGFTHFSLPWAHWEVLIDRLLAKHLTMVSIADSIDPELSMPEYAEEVV